MQDRQHLLMQNTRYRNSIRTDAIKDDMLATFHAAQARTNFFTGPAYRGCFSKLLAERP